MIQRTCKCGRPFEVPYPSSKRLNCSAKCRGVKTKVRADAGTRKVEWEDRECARCGVVFQVVPHEARRRARRFCSLACANKRTEPAEKYGRPRRIERERYLTDEGYVRVYVTPDGRPPGHRKSHVLEHRVVMGQILGRHLLPDENVHHKNGVKTDNRPANLELWTTKQPKGQRAADLLEWAREIVARYEPVEAVIG